MTKVNKNSFKENTHKVSIDSFRVSIPVEKVKIIDANLTDKLTTYTINNNTQEVLTEKEVKENSILKEINGAKFRFNIDNSFNSSRVVILINAKQLNSNYFDGITQENITSVYDNLIRCKVIDVDIETFMMQPITDVDFKKDTIINYDDYHKSLSIIKDCSKLSKFKDDGCILFANGIEFSTRKTSKYLSNPFFKIYHKEIELMQNSADFTNKHLKGIDFRNGVRFECTIKNKKHFQSLGVENNSLITVLRLSNEVKDKILSTIVKKHLNKREMSKPNKNIGLNPSQQIMYIAISLLLDNGNTIDGSITYILSSFNGVTKSRKKKELISVYENYIMGTIAEKRSIKMNSFFDSLGWN